MVYKSNRTFSARKTERGTQISGTKCLGIAPSAVTPLLKNKREALPSPVRPTTTTELPWLNGVITPNNLITVYHGTAFFNFAHNSVIFSQY